MSNKHNKSEPVGDKPAGLPLFYSLPRALDSVRHAKASISRTTDFSFAKQANSIPLNTIEFIQAAKDYPIVFTTSEDVIPVAIVGLEKENYFVDSKHSWQENSYIPAYVRQYPFIFFENPQDKKFYLCVDEASQNFSPEMREGANALYGKEGKATDFTDNALKFCSNFYQHHVITKNFCKDLKAMKFLQPYQSEVTLVSGRKAQLSGFQMIDEKALNALSNKDYLALREKGWLPFIYMMLFSISNWNSLIAMEAKQA